MLMSLIWEFLRKNAVSLNYWQNIMRSMVISLHDIQAWKISGLTFFNLYYFTMQVKSVNRKQRKASILFIDDPMIHKRKG